MTNKLKQKIVVVVIIGMFLSFGTVSASQPAHVPASDDAETIVATGNISTFIWSSDGTRLAYVTYLDGQSWGALWVCDWDGHTATNPQLIYSEIEVNGLLD